MGNESKLCNKKVANFMKFATFALYLSFQSLERAKEICYISPNIIPFIIRFTLIFICFSFIIHWFHTFPNYKYTT